jgi:hypothetical protein
VPVALTCMPVGRGELFAGAGAAGTSAAVISAVIVVPAVPLLSPAFRWWRRRAVLTGTECAVAAVTAEPPVTWMGCHVVGNSVAFGNSRVACRVRLPAVIAGGARQGEGE